MDDINYMIGYIVIFNISVCDNNTVWYVREDNMPGWVSEAVIKVLLTLFQCYCLVLL